MPRVMAIAISRFRVTLWRCQAILPSIFTSDYWEPDSANHWFAGVVVEKA
jgi:hypothetical protein